MPASAQSWAPHTLAAGHEEVVIAEPRPGLLYSTADDPPLVRSTDFDVRAFTRSAFGDHRDGVDTAAFVSKPLDDPTLQALTYLWNVERSATDTLRRVLATSTHRESRFTAFLVTWAYDKYWFAKHLERVLEPHGVDVDAPLPHGHTLYDRMDHGADRIARLADPVWTTVVGEPVAALHATRGLAAEGAELAAYARLLDLVDHRELKAVIDLIVERKERHHAFFAAEARMRLVDDPNARRLTRAALTVGFHPLRPGGLPVVDNHRFQRFLFTDGAKDRVVDRADAASTRLPGARTRGPLETALRRERPLV